MTIQRKTPTLTPQSTQTGAPAQTGDGSSGRVQLKSALRGMSYDDQMAAISPVQAKGDADPEAVHQHAAAGVAGGGSKLPHLDAIQQSFGHHDVGSIASHTGGAAAKASDAMGAEAYATGNAIAFKKAPDLHTTAHEAAHIVQQRAGVSLSGGVGQSGDAYEQHADKVADAVVAGQSAAPILDQMSGKSGGDGVQKRAVQQKATSSGGVTGAEGVAVEERARQRGIGLETQDQYDRNGKVTGNARVNTDASKSMAENPAFEADALKFEKALGQAAFTKGGTPANMMAEKARAYLLEKAGGGNWNSRNAELKAQIEASGIGSDSAAWSGSVGKDFQALLDALNTGNCSVKMMHMHQFYTKVMLPDAQADVGAIETLIAGITDITNREKAEEQVAAAKAASPGRAAGVGYAVPSGSEVEGQGGARAYRHGENRSDQRKGSNPVPTTKQTVAKAGVALDPNELKIQAGTSGGASAATMKLQWEEGAEKWALNEKNKWVYLMRELSLPLAAGPSGTTNGLMNMGVLFGMDPVQTRMACMGYLLPPNHHSLVEVLAAAAAHGPTFIQGRQMYTDIEGFSPEELKGFGGGKFPHETHGDKVLDGTTVRDA